MYFVNLLKSLAFGALRKQGVLESVFAAIQLDFSQDVVDSRLHLFACCRISVPYQLLFWVLILRLIIVLIKPQLLQRPVFLLIDLLLDYFLCYCRHVVLDSDVLGG